MKKKLLSRKPKRVLRLPDLDHSKTAVLNTLGSQESQRSYRFAIEDFIAWYCSEPRLAFNKNVVLRYRLQLEARHLAASTINVRLAAVRRLAYEAADSGLLSPELAASIRRVKGPKKLGVRIGNWLTAQQGKALLSIPAAGSVRGKRDHAMLALLLGCGLRRSEPFDNGAFAAARGALCHRRFGWQRWSCANGSRPGVGQSGHRHLGHNREHQHRQAVSRREQARPHLGAG